jgi:hypothetical protein
VEALSRSAVATNLVEHIRGNQEAWIEEPQLRRVVHTEEVQKSSVTFESFGTDTEDDPHIPAPRSPITSYGESHLDLHRDARRRLEVTANLGITSFVVRDRNVGLDFAAASCKSRAQERKLANRTLLDI